MFTNKMSETPNSLIYIVWTKLNPKKGSSQVKILSTDSLILNFGLKKMRIIQVKEFKSSSEEEYILTTLSSDNKIVILYKILVLHDGEYYETRLQGKLATISKENMGNLLSISDFSVMTEGNNTEKLHIVLISEKQNFIKSIFYDLKTERLNFEMSYNYKFITENQNSLDINVK